MAVPILVVVGATGTQGASVVDSFVADPTWHVRAITRNAASSKAQDLARRGCEVVQADLNDSASLRRAFQGSTAIFAVTDYWAPFFDANVKSKLGSGQSVPEYCYQEEIRLGINMAEAAAATADTLTHYVWSSLSSPSKWSNGKYRRIYHFESKAAITEYIHAKLPQLAIKMSVIQVAFYATNLFYYDLMRPEKQSDGTFRLDRLVPEASRLPFVDTRKDTGPFVRALVERKPGNVLLAYTAMLSFRDLAKMVNRITQKNVIARQCSLTEIEAKFPNEGEEGSLSDVYAMEYGFHGGDPNCLKPEDFGFKERPEAIESCLAELDWASVMN